MAVKKPTGALPKGGGQAASGTKLAQSTVSQSNKVTPIPAGAINPQKIYSPAAIAADFKVPLTPAQQAYQTKITAERMQAQADAYFKANPQVKEDYDMSKAAERALVLGVVDQKFLTNLSLL
jgi:hypothetical protein